MAFVRIAAFVVLEGDRAEGLRVGDRRNRLFPASAGNAVRARAVFPVAPVRRDINHLLRVLVVVRAIAVPFAAEPVLLGAVDIQALIGRAFVGVADPFAVLRVGGVVNDNAAVAPGNGRTVLVADLVIGQRVRLGAHAGIRGVKTQNVALIAVRGNIDHLVRGSLVGDLCALIGMVRVKTQNVALIAVRGNPGDHDDLWNRSVRTPRALVVHGELPDFDRAADGKQAVPNTVAGVIRDAYGGGPADLSHIPRPARKSGNRRDGNGTRQRDDGHQKDDREKQFLFHCKLLFVVLLYVVRSGL